MDCFFPKTNQFADRLIAVIPKDTEDELELARKWIRHRAERWEASVKRHSGNIDPHEIKACRTIELDYLKKLRTALDIAIEEFEKVNR